MLKHPGTRLGYFGPTYPAIRDIFYPTFEEAANLLGLDVLVKSGDKEVVVTRGKTVLGTVICRSMDNPGSIVGFKIAAAVVDELDVLSREDLGPSYALNRRDAGLEQFYSPFLIQNGVVRNPTTGSIMHESELLEKCCYRGGSDAVILGYDAGGSAISVQRTNIIRISVEFRTCHVYTLSSSQGYYTAGSAIVKNCRARDGMQHIESEQVSRFLECRVEDVAYGRVCRAEVAQARTGVL